LILFFSARDLLQQLAASARAANHFLSFSQALLHCAFPDPFQQQQRSQFKELLAGSAVLL
jgi:hypothetical protein